MSTFTAIDLMLNNTDKWGNQLVTKETQENVWEIKLKQANEDRWRMIGHLLNLDGEVIYQKNESEDDKYLKTKAWTIHASILDYCEDVHYDTPFAHYAISAVDAKRSGAKIVYENNSLTAKIIVPIRHWTVKCREKKDQFILDMLGYEWYDELKDEFSKLYMVRISRFIAQQRLKTTVYPSTEQIFRAFKLTPFMDVKVVIIGQDPYHGAGEANGLAFSVNANVLKTPPSLENINKEVESDYDEGFSLFRRTDLTRWAEQGVFLLNTSLTVEKDNPSSHSKIGWQTFTTEAVRKLLLRKGNPIVFMLWGKHAQSAFLPLITGTRHLALIAPHPSPFSAHTGFFGCKHFTLCNKFLKDSSQREISW